MERKRFRLLALLEVIGIFLITKAVMQAVNVLVSHDWQITLLGTPFMHYLAGLAVLLAVILIRRRKGAFDGFLLKPIFFHLEAAASCFLPVAAIAIALTMTDWKTWPGALLVAAITLVSIPLCAILLRKVVPEKAKKLLPLLILISGLILSILIVGRMTSCSHVVGLFIFTFLLVGPIEEGLFRGYFQSRLNELFEKRFSLLGISFGWGLIITAALFSLWHLPLPFIFASQLDFIPQHALWTFFVGILFGLVREKTGSIIAPAILHFFLNFL